MKKKNLLERSVMERGIIYKACKVVRQHPGLDFYRETMGSEKKRLFFIFICLCHAKLIINDKGCILIFFFFF